MSIKKTRLIIFAFVACAAFLLFPDYSSAQMAPLIDPLSDPDWAKKMAENMTPRGRCKGYRSGYYGAATNSGGRKLDIKIDTENRCLMDVLYWSPYDKKYNLSESIDNYLSPDGKKFCEEIRDGEGNIDRGPTCVPMIRSEAEAEANAEEVVKIMAEKLGITLPDFDFSKRNEEGTIPSSGGWSEEANLPEPIIIKKGEPYEYDFSHELIQLFDTRDQSGPYTFSLNTMGGFPPMGLMLGSNGVLKGTPIGKDDHFEACVKNGSGRTVCKVINIKLEKDKSDKLELNLIESIKSVFEPAKSTEINYQDLIYGERGQIKSKIHERIAILMKDGSIVEMDKNSTLTPNSEYELTTEIGKFKFKYERFLGPNSFCAFGALLSESCRQINTPNGTIRIKGTEFTVENDSSGTSIAVIEGTVLVSDAKNKKEFEISEGQFVFLKKGILSEAPQSFEPSQLDSWWEEEGAELSDKEDDKFTLFVLGIFTLVLLTVAIIKKLLRKKIMSEGEERADATEHKIRAVFSLIIGAGTIFLMLIFYLNPKSLPQSVLDAIISLVFPCIGLVGLMMGIMEVKLSEKILSAFMIILNIISVVVWIVFVMPRY